MNKLIKIFAICLALLFVQGILSTQTLAADTKSKTKKVKKVSSKKSKRSKKRRTAKKHLVPPPPPYAPSILPELAYSRRYGKKVKTEEVEEKPNPYAKYIYHRDASKVPTIKSSSQGTTEWRHES